LNPHFLEEPIMPRPQVSAATLPAGLMALAAIAVVCFLIWFVNSSNPETPAGYVGYLTQGAIFGSARFHGTQTGPTSPGRTWMLSVVNVSITPYTYTEEFTGEGEVLSKDNLNIGFRVHITWRVKADGVKDFIERFSTLAPHDAPDKIMKVAYDNFLREPLRTYARNEVQKRDGMRVKDELLEMGTTLLADMHKLAKDTPFDIGNVVVGNIRYPTVVANSVAENLAATQRLEQATKEAQRRVVEAKGIAESMDIINQKLTPAYLQHEAIESQKAMAGSPSHSVIYIPSGANGVPLVGTVDMTAPKK
jgi:regulator of protease activity HflC (stomatin/prohibitin superfamily)